MDNSIIQLEESIDLTKFMYKGENIWPLFRNMLVFAPEYEKNFENNDTFLARFRRLLSVFSSVKYIFLLKNLFFYKYDYIFFTCEGAYGKKSCLTQHKHFGYLYHKISSRKILEIQLGSSVVVSDTTRKYLSYDLLSFFKAVLARFIFINSNVENIESELKKINSSINVRKVIKRYIAGEIIDRLLLKIVQPKKIFMDSNSFWSTIKVAHEFSIPSFEFQHGVVVNHTYYNVEIDVNKSFYPDYFITFGKVEWQYLQDKCFSKNIISVGNMMIDHYYDDVKNIEIQNLKKIFKYVVCVSLQNSVLKTLVDYIVQQAALFDDMCFILIPRYENDLAGYDFSMQKNIKVFLNINTYEIITNSDYHITCYSTCAQEAPSLGVQNIFINFYNTSIINYEEFIRDYDFNYCIEPSSDLSIIYSIVKKDKESIRLANQKNISTDYKNNMDNFILDFDL